MTAALGKTQHHQQPLYSSIKQGTQTNKASLALTHSPLCLPLLLCVPVPVRLCTLCAALCCWPVAATASSRFVSSQRYQMAQLHPSVLAKTMEATGLRDADYDDEEADTSYDEDDVIMAGWGADINDTHDDIGAIAPGSDQHHAQTGGGCLNSNNSGGNSSGGGGFGGSGLQRLGMAGGAAGEGSGPRCLSPKRVEALIGSLPALGGCLNLPLSPSSSSTHSSAGHMYAGSLGSSLHHPYGLAGSAAATAGVMGRFPGLWQQ